MSNGPAARNILISGCSSGIGLACAEALQQRGWRVHAGVRTEADAGRLQQRGLEPVHLDVDHPASIAAAVDTVLERSGGRIEALFNNAGYGQPGAVEDLDRDTLRAQFETNLFGAHELTCRVLPHMRRAGRGRILFNSSVLGFAALPYRGAYNASKFAMEGLADTLRLELAGTGIRVSLIEPGPIASRFRNRAREQFHARIRTEHSVHRSVYAALERRFQTEDTAGAGFTLGPEAVARQVLHAVESASPRPRYRITLPTIAFAWARRILSTRMMDRLLLLATASERR